MSRWIQVCWEVLPLLFHILFYLREAKNLTNNPRVCWFWAPLLIKPHLPKSCCFPFDFQVALTNFSGVNCCFLTIVAAGVTFQLASGGLFGPCCFFCHLIQEATSTVAPGQLSSGPLFFPFFFSLLLLFITAFLLSPCHLMPLSLTLPAIIGGFEVKARFVPTRKYYFGPLCVLGSWWE